MKLLPFMVYLGSSVVLNLAYYLAWQSTPSRIIVSTILFLPPSLFVLSALLGSRSSLKKGLFPTFIHLFISGLVLPKQFSFLFLTIVGFEVIAAVLVIFMLVRYFNKSSREKRMKEISNGDFAYTVIKDLGKYVSKNPAVRLAHGEITVGYYLLQGAKSKPEATKSQTYLFQKDLEDWKAVIIGITLALLMEALIVHFLVAQFSHILAWILSFLSAYSVAWLWGDFNAMRLVPTSVEAKQVIVRLGLRLRTETPTKNIANMSHGEYRASAFKEDELLDATPRGMGNVLLELRTPITAYKIFNIEQTASKILLNIENPQLLTESTGRSSEQLEDGKVVSDASEKAQVVTT